MTVTLTVTAGPHSGREFAFDGHDTFLVGRSKNAHFQLSYDDPYFSRQHFLIEVNPPRVRVYDLNSRNGISVNGEKTRTAELKHGDELKAGHTIFRVSVPLPIPSDPDVVATLNVPTVKGALLEIPDTIDHVPSSPVPGYTLEAELGRGGMGVVYRATRHSDGESVAVKLITPAEGVAKRETDRFLRESAIMMKLDHRNIVRCHESGHAGTQLYLVMELIDGTDMRQRVKERGPMEVQAAVRLMLHVLDGLAYAHANGFIHRDVKPANLMIAGPKNARVAKLTDFGLARAYNDCNMSGLTMQGEMGGTPAFMPPEQVTHYREAKPAADQYSAAATLYWLLTRAFVLDFERDQTAQMIQIVSDERLPIRKRRADLPQELEAVLAKALALDPQKRFADVTAFKTALKLFA
jgi:serine/threonine-protein kinase